MGRPLCMKFKTAFFILSANPAKLEQTTRASNSLLARRRGDRDRERLKKREQDARESSAQPRSDRL